MLLLDLPKELHRAAINLHFCQAFLTLTRTRYRKGCTDSESTFAFTKRSWLRHARFIERVARARYRLSLLRSVIDIGMLDLPKGLHGRAIDLHFYEAFLTSACLIYRKGCSGPDSTLTFRKRFWHRRAQFTERVAPAENRFLKNTTLLMTCLAQVRYCCSFLKSRCCATVHRVREIGTLKLRC